MGKLFRQSLVVALSGFLLVASAPSQLVAAADPYNTSAQQTLINQDRAQNGGLSPLAWNDCLYTIAKQNADRIAAQGYLSHTTGPSLDLKCIAGATYAGENIAYTSAGIDDAMANTMFMNSAPHRANILGNFNLVATAWTVAPNGYGYVAEEFLNAPVSLPAPPPQPKSPFTSMFTLDAFGRIYADGSTTPMTSSAYWPNWRIANAVVALPDGSGGYVLDGFGGLHPFGAAQPAQGAPYWANWNVAGDVALLPTSTASAAKGYTLDAFGGLHPFGGAPSVSGAAYWPNWAVANRVVLFSDGSGGYVMDAFGGLHGFAVGSNPMPPVIANEAYWPNWRIARDITLTPGSTAANVSGFTLDGYGGLHPFGSAASVSGPYWPNWDIARSVRLSPQSTASQPQGWVLDGFGGLHPFGGAPSVLSGGYPLGKSIATQLAEA